MAYVKLSSMPSQNKTYNVDFPNLNGGLNLQELDYRVKNNQSPEMKNLWWQDGLLQCRDGQQTIIPNQNKVGYAAFQEEFWGYGFAHIGNSLYCFNPDAASPTYIKLAESIPENRGTFLRYNEWLIYKNRGGFYKISYKAESTPPFEVTDATANAYVPTIVINANPDTGSGDMYQPENRLTSAKKVLYNPTAKEVVHTAKGDGSTKVFSLPKTSASGLSGVKEVRVDDKLVEAARWDLNAETGKLTFVDAPESDAEIKITMLIAISIYYLPDKTADMVREYGSGGNHPSISVISVKKITSTG